ncbi:hypothetical protein BIT28_22400 [Photobacterium proteolyticum]|uniref:Lipoprotein n=1 Tax=Photobacterium proteolyticum TaxID=1903952 RepID=A0A1Q9GGB6_9GAMM|nr:hypothetical protein [Photobacterium proteolyticum]OLQ73477.1 hypothetical protein BIT28_22400 [Photobacterium proteolyticum]
MNYQKRLRTAILICPLFFIGCGGDSSSTSVEQEKRTITVIDGYLQNATICIDKNNNKRCDLNEEIAQRTNEMGQVKIDLADAQYPIIAKAIAGITTDSDKVTPLTQSYALIASANANYVTPFSTLAHLDNLSLQEFAEKIGVDYAAISRDFVGDKQSESQVAHLLARSITPFLEEQVSDNDSSSLNERAGEIRTLIHQKENAGIDLSAIDISYDTHSGVFYSKPKLTSIESHISEQAFIYSIFSNHYIANGHNYDEIVSFNDGTVSYRGNQELYRLDGNTLHYGNKGFTFLIMNDDYLFSFSEDNNPGLWTQGSTSPKPAVQVEDDFVAGKTLYHLRDINTSDVTAPLPKLTKLAFDSKDKVVVTPEGESGFTASWQVKDWTNHNDQTFRTIYIEFPEDQQNRASLKSEKSMILEMVLVSNEISVAINHSSIALVNENIVINDANFARLIYRKWLN